MIFTLGNINFAQKNERSLSEVLTEVSVATKWLQKIRNYREKSHFLKETTLKTPENTPSYTIDYPTLIREGGRTVGSGRVATIIE